MTGRKVRPLMSKVNSTNPVASTATAFLTPGSIPLFSVTASASAKVTAPRNPPQVIASLYTPLTFWLRWSTLNSGNSPNNTAIREASAAATATSSSQASSRCTPLSNLGTNVEALIKISELAQKPVCSQTRSRYRQLSGARRTRPMAPAVSPALTTATTPETSNSCSASR